MAYADTPLVLIFIPAENGLPGLGLRHAAVLRRRSPGVEWRVCRDREEFLDQLPRARAVAVWRFREEWLARAPRLALVSTPSAGREWIEAGEDSGPEVAFGRFHGLLIGETVLGMMLALARGIRDSLERMSRGESWPRREVADAMRLIRGSHAVILGFGNIGKGIGTLLKPMGVALTGINRQHLECPDYFVAGDRVLPLKDLDSVLPDADHLILALPGGRETDHVIDARRLSLLPDHARVYNIGRGNSLDLSALVAALQAERLGGAGLDVFPEEPLPADAPIRRCRNVIITPHVSAFAPQYMEWYMEELLAQVRRHFPEGATTTNREGEK